MKQSIDHLNHYYLTISPQWTDITSSKFKRCVLGIYFFKEQSERGKWRQGEKEWVFQLASSLTISPQESEHDHVKIRSQKLHKRFPHKWQELEYYATICCLPKCLSGSWKLISWNSSQFSNMEMPASQHSWTLFSSP